MNALSSPTFWFFPPPPITFRRAVGGHVWLAGPDGAVTRRQEVPAAMRSPGRLSASVRPGRAVHNRIEEGPRPRRPARSRVVILPAIIQTRRVVGGHMRAASLDNTVVRHPRVLASMREPRGL